MKICLVNMDVAFKNKEENLSSIERHIQKIKNIVDNIDTVVFPELACLGYVLDNTVTEFSETFQGSCVSTIQQFAVKYGVNIISGFLEKNDTEKPYNTTFAVNKDGHLVGKYRKNHLYSESEEIHLYSRGEGVSIFELDGWKCGFAICMDIRYPRLFETLTLAGAELIFIPANWTQGENKFEMLQAYTRVRAGENQVYCASVDRIGKDAYFEYTGSWMLSDPIGVDVSSTFEDIYHIGEVKKERIEEVRKRLPLKNSYREKYMWEIK